jgi:hypothetical protein
MCKISKVHLYTWFFFALFDFRDSFMYESLYCSDFLKGSLVQ